MNSELKSNHLKNSKSLYLRQHQNNPVNWFSYGPEALTKAQTENKPILLSIGYSSCHWCHVMNQESFNNEEVAAILNENFVCIKVDREEHPDLDNYYQKAAQMFGSQGGWPLNAFLLPDMRAYFVGTYFPLQSKDGPNFPGLINELKRAFKEESEQVLNNAKQVTEAIANGNVPEGTVQFEGHFPHPNGIFEAVKGFRDEKWGGYGEAPKFPSYAYYEWAIEQMLEGMVSKEHGEFVINTLEKMLMGGLHDHARGGVHRYSTDEKWLVPHFEKMLYDQAGFLKTMNKLSLVYPTPLVIDSIINTLDYLEQEMLSDLDGEGKRHFFSAQDADSEGVEGLYFTFTEAEFEDLLNRNDNEEEVLAKNMSKIKNWFQISTKGNFENNLNVISLNPELKNEIYEQGNWDIIRMVRRAITAERKDRMPPMTDNKGIASWNFMIISALCDLVQYSQIDIVKKIASNLLNSSLEGVFKTFLNNTEHGLKMFHTTTLDSRYPYLEDFVTFAESQLRLYEISSNEVFKQNFMDAMGFINKEFVNGNQMKTRAKSTEKSDLLPNQDYNIFDASFKSMTTTYIGLARRAAALFSDRSYVDSILMLIDNVTNTVLKINPVNAGEALRSLSYPGEVYRVIKIPKGWIQKEDFLKLIPFFLPRFVFSYTDVSDESFEICSLTACEVSGIGYEEFKKKLIPQSTEETKA